MDEPVRLPEIVLFVISSTPLFKTAPPLNEAVFSEKVLFDIVRPLPLYMAPPSEFTAFFENVQPVVDVVPVL
jgi:hypothetical protein